MQQDSSALTPSPTLPRKRGRGYTESVALALAKSLAFIR
jgi:hypothetical protein